MSSGASDVRLAAPGSSDNTKRRRAGFVRRSYRFAQRQLLGTITHVATTEPVAALTFDDGPDPTSTPLVLDVLAKHQAYGTFFMLGSAASRYPDLVREVAARGHAIGNHTWDHPALPSLTHRERFRQIRACRNTLADSGQGLFRPPYGEQNMATRLDLLCFGYQVVTWNTDSGDWWNPDAPAMADHLIQHIRPGCIVVFHDAISPPPAPENMPPLSREILYDRSAMLAALDQTLAHLDGRFRFVTVPQLLQRGRPHKTVWSSWRDSGN
jgi:peptidoglycan/xylan/chitin deacetylase (PgdA/CDA1 family)